MVTSNQSSLQISVVPAYTPARSFTSASWCFLFIHSSSLLLETGSFLAHSSWGQLWNPDPPATTSWVLCWQVLLTTSGFPSSGLYLHRHNTRLCNGFLIRSTMLFLHSKSDMLWFWKSYFSNVMCYLYSQVAKADVY